MIKRGEDWGQPGALAMGRAVFASDRQLSETLDPAEFIRALVSPNTQSQQDTPEFGLTGGDLHRTLGSPRHTTADLRGGAGMRFPLDVGLATIADANGSTRTEVFLAHLESRGGRQRFSGESLVAMNAAFIGEDNVGPRAHPGDGLIDVTVGELGWWDRIRSKSRQRTGSHLPHPELRLRRAAHHTPDLMAEGRIIVDGDPVGRGQVLEIRCVASAIVVVV